MSPLTVTDTLSVPEALAVVRDILAQTDGEAVLLALTERTVWPLTRLNQRFCVNGCLALLRESAGAWYWEVYASPTGHSFFLDEDWERGRASSREEADAAVTEVLRRRGFHCMGAP